jgi:hypothetical protein
MSLNTRILGELFDLKLGRGFERSEFNGRPISRTYWLRSDCANYPAARGDRVRTTHRAGVEGRICSSSWIASVQLSHLAANLLVAGAFVVIDFDKFPAHDSRGSMTYVAEWGPPRPSGLKMP